MSGNQRAKTATEIMAKLEKDPEWQRKRREQEARLDAMDEFYARAEEPILKDLVAAGVHESLWDLAETPNPIPAALPIVLEHLERGGYPERTMNVLARCLAVKPAVVYWDRLKYIWQHPRDTHFEGEEDGAAVALAACATKEQWDDLVSFLSIEERGLSRIYFLRAILRVGGTKGAALVEGLRDDPVFGEEATALTNRRQRRKQK